MTTTRPITPSTHPTLRYPRNLSRGIEGSSYEVTGIPHEGYRVYLSEEYGAGCSAGEEVWAQRWQDLLGYSREDNGCRETE